MSVALGLDPHDLLDLDGPMFDALERAAGARWTVADELAAQALELAHAHFVAFLAVHSKKGARLPNPLRVQRPTEDGYPSPPVLSPSQFAAEYGRREVA